MAAGSIGGLLAIAIWAGYFATANYLTKCYKESTSKKTTKELEETAGVSEEESTSTDLDGPGSDVAPNTDAGNQEAEDSSLAPALEIPADTDHNVVPAESAATDMIKSRNVPDTVATCTVTVHDQPSNADEPECEPDIHFCGNCGKPLVAGNAYCVYCGKKVTVPVTIEPASDSDVQPALQGVQQEDDRKPAKKATAKKLYKKILIPAAIVLVLLLALFGGYYFTYSRSVSFAEREEFDNAEAWLLFPEITKLHDPKLSLYIDAGQLMEGEKFHEAFVVFNTLHYMNSADLTRETQYRKAIKAYEDGDLYAALGYFEWCKKRNYKDSATYYKQVVNDINVAIAAPIWAALDDEDYETAYNLYSESTLDATYFGADAQAYFEAYALYADGDYENAKDKFAQLEDFYNSAEMVLECQYQYGMSKVENGYYLSAAKVFEDLGDYSDSADMVFECAYLEAVKFWEDEKYIKAYQKMQEISDYEKAQTKLTEWQSSLYDTAKTYYKSARSKYKNGDNYNWSFNNALKYFNAVSTYAYSANYIKLINGFLYTNDEVYSGVLSMIKYDDGKYLLMNKQSFALNFLKGYWVTSGGSYYFQITEDSSGYTSYYNLPRIDYSGYFSIDDGIYTVGSSSNKMWKFTIIDKNTITCYCYSNGATYTMYRQ